MLVLRSPVFIICAALFITHQAMQKVCGLHFPLIDNYLDNLLAMPIILTLLLAERIVLFKKEKNYQLPSATIIITTLYIIVITEIIFPLLSDKYSGDWTDAVFYCIGAALFYSTINKVETRTMATESYKP
jgi:hypothetical protein